MIETILAFAKTYPVLAGGVGTVVFGSAMYFVRGIPIWIFGMLRRALTIEISLNSESFLYHEILDVLSSCRIGAFARCYATDHNGDLVSGFGSSLALFNRRFIVFNRELIEKNFRLDEKLSVTIFSRDIGVLRKIIAKARMPKIDESMKIYATSSSGGYWLSPVKRRRRDLRTVFANGDTKQRIIESIKWFLDNEDWYARRGIPYKLVFMLHGQPGAGKSSLIYGMASEFGRGIGAVTSINGIDETLRSLPENTFGAIEDIDMLSIARKEDAEPEKGHAPTPTAPAPARDANTERQLSALQMLINTVFGSKLTHGTGARK